VTTSEGSYYELNGQSNGETGDVIQPFFSYDSWAFWDETARCVPGGRRYTNYAGFDPVIGVPKSDAHRRGGREGPLPALRTLTPMDTITFETSEGRPGSIPTCWSTREFRERDLGGEPVQRHAVHGVVLEFADVTPPAFVDPGAGAFTRWMG